jgi:iron(III) transport system ATP-binding protein
LFVTHEQIEALTMSDSIAVMSDGIIVQQGSPSQIYGEPQAIFVADFIGRTNFLKAKVVTIERGDTIANLRVDTPIGMLSCQMGSPRRQGDEVTIAVRPENVDLIRANGEASVDNAVTGEVEAVVFLGNMLDCTVRVGPQQVRVQVHPSHAPQLGESVTLRLPAEHCLVIPGQPSNR